MKKEFEKRILSSLIIIPISLFFIVKGSVFFSFFLSIFFLATCYEWIKMNKKDLLKFLGAIYLFTITYLAYSLRENFGLNIFIFIIIICIFTDIGGYVFGKIFKGPKLTKISPNKTYSGVFGSYFLSIFFVFFLFNNYYSYKELFFFVIILSTISQLGDLFISFLKRKAKIKDTGKILPGHGGVLDRLDGIFLGTTLGFLFFTLIF